MIEQKGNILFIIIYGICEPISSEVLYEKMNLHFYSLQNT